MSIVPSGSASASSACRRSASHTPPVYRPIIAVFGPTSGLSSATRPAHKLSASGSDFIEVLLENQLCCVRVELPRSRGPGGATRARRLAHAALGCGGSVALIDAHDLDAVPVLQLAREALDARREGMGPAVVRNRPADHQPPGAPL